MYTITLRRHAQSLGNIRSVHQGQSEFPLSELGRRQAYALPEGWKTEGRRFDRIFCSPLERACETCEIVNAVLGAPVEKDRAWAQRDLGALTGLTHAEASQRVPRALRNLLSNPPGSYLVASHRAILGMTLYAIFGVVPLANFHGPRFHFENTGSPRSPTIQPTTNAACTASTMCAIWPNWNTAFCFPNPSPPTRSNCLLGSL